VLSGTHEGVPGLPRGKSGLPAQEVRAAQRDRLLRAVIAAVAQAGYRDVTIADIVRRARVSRAAFYAHFADKEECFLAATNHGGQLMGERVRAATRAVPREAGAEGALRASVAAFLHFLVTEPQFARAFYIDMPAAGAGAAAQLETAHRGFARMNRIWHERALQEHPDWPVVPREAYYALAGGSAELVRALVRRDAIAELPRLEEPLVALHLAVLAGRRWPPPAGPSADPPAGPPAEPAAEPA
jgi:AcrR family transcriptional regulator